MRLRALAPAVLAAALAAGAANVAAPPPITFKDVTRRAGLTFKFATDLRRGRLLSTMGGGVAMGDYDGDGWPDLFFTGSVAKGEHPEKGPCGVLYKNRGDGTFEDVTEKSGIHDCGWAMGASWVDLDSTGRLDLVVTGTGRVTLWKGRGDGTFFDASTERGLVDPRYAVGLAAGDVNGDGRVDLYVVNYLESTYEKEKSFPTIAIRMPDEYEGQDALLFVQKEDGSFVERAKEAGVLNHDGRGLCGIFFDYDGDGIQDIYVTNDRMSNRLYKGRGDGSFEDVTAETGTGAGERSVPMAGMGLAVGDVNGDGRPEILVTNFAGEPTMLFRNVEGQLFDDATATSGIGAATEPWVQWGAEIADLDDDGAPDVVTVSGQLVPRILLWWAQLTNPRGLGFYGRGNRSYKQPPTVLRGHGDATFEDVTRSTGDMAKVKLVARGLVAGDADGDGRLDLVIAAEHGGIRLMRSSAGSTNHVLEVLPVAGADRRTVLGTTVRVTAGGKTQTREFILRSTYASGAWMPLHFGLGAATVAEKVEVLPPGATEPKVSFENVAADRLYALFEGRLNERRAFRR
jgi:hypothetical protein